MGHLSARHHEHGARCARLADRRRAVSEHVADGSASAHAPRGPDAATCGQFVRRRRAAAGTSRATATRSGRISIASACSSGTGCAKAIAYGRDYARLFGLVIDARRAADGVSRQGRRARPSRSMPSVRRSGARSTAAPTTDLVIEITQRRARLLRPRRAGHRGRARTRAPSRRSRTSSTGPARRPDRPADESRSAA